MYTCELELWATIGRQRTDVISSFKSMASENVTWKLLINEFESHRPVNTANFFS